MATCKFCNCDRLEWGQDPDTDRYFLKEADGTPHRCMNKPGNPNSRLSPVYRLLDGLGSRELAAVVNYIVRLLADKAEPVGDRAAAAEALERKFAPPVSSDTSSAVAGRPQEDPLVTEARARLADQRRRLSKKLNDDRHNTADPTSSDSEYLPADSNLPF